MYEDDWEDFSTAPQDGRKIDIWMVEHYTDGLGIKKTRGYRLPDCWWSVEEECWRANQEPIYLHSWVGKPTHWRDVPEAPYIPRPPMYGPPTRSEYAIQEAMRKLFEVTAQKFLEKKTFLAGTPYAENNSSEKQVLRVKLPNNFTIKKE